MGYEGYSGSVVVGQHDEERVLAASAIRRRLVEFSAGRQGEALPGCGESGFTLECVWSTRTGSDAFCNRRAGVSLEVRSPVVDARSLREG